MTATTGRLHADLVALLAATHDHILKLQYGCFVFNPAGLSSSGSQGVTQSVRYDTQDSLATVEAAGYFDSYALTFQTGDTLQVNSEAGSGGGYRAYQISVSGGAVTLTPHQAMAQRVAVPYSIRQLDLAIGTVQYLRAPLGGQVVGHNCVVQTTVVSGGTLTLAVVGAGTMTGGVLTIANGTVAGTPVDGTPVTANPASTVTTGGVLSVSPSSTFNGGGAVAGEILIQPV